MTRQQYEIIRAMKKARGWITSRQINEAIGGKGSHRNVIVQIHYLREEHPEHLIESDLSGPASKGYLYHGEVAA